MNFEDITQKMVKLGKVTVEEVQKMNRIRQLNSKVSSEKKKINSRKHLQRSKIKPRQRLILSQILMMQKHY